MRHIKQLANQIEITLPADENGYIGRECPKCKSYFKIVNGTGLQGEDLPCYCPYCGHVSDHSEFFTQQQIKYAESVAIKRVMNAVTRDCKDMARRFNQKCSGGFLSLSMDVQASNTPLRYYCEKKLETHVECNNCTLKYAVYGVFAYCPDCGQHNSVQILENNLGLVNKILEFAEKAQPEVARRLIENALENCVSAFDGFGRELCCLHAKEAKNPSKAAKISFQNLEIAKDKVLVNFNFDLSSIVNEGQWESIVQAFQKRHLLTHKMGVIDHDYVKKTGDTSAVVGRKINITSQEIATVMQIIKNLSKGIICHLESTKNNE